MDSSTQVSQQASEITRRNVRTVRELEALATSDPSFADRAASFVARFCGSIHFVSAHALLIVGWIALNSIPGLLTFDPYPFTLLTLWASAESIFLASFILIAQNYAMRISDRRAQLDLQVNLLAEQESTKTLQLLDEIAKAVGVRRADDPEIRALAEATRLEALVGQLDEMRGKEKEDA